MRGIPAASGTVWRVHTDEYVNREGRCTACGSDDIEWLGSDVDGYTIVYRYTCNACGQGCREINRIIWVCNEPVQ